MGENFLSGLCQAPGPVPEQPTVWCFDACSLTRSRSRARSLSLSQMKRKDNALWWVLTPLEMLVQKFIITPQIPEKCYLIESNRADSMVKCPASSSHLIPTLLAEKLLAFSSFTLSISSWKEHCTYDGRKTPVKKHIGFLVVISFISETATDLFNCRIHWARLCLFHCLGIPVAFHMAPNTEQALGKHLSLMMQKTGRSDQETTAKPWTKKSELTEKSFLVKKDMT